MRPLLTAEQMRACDSYTIGQGTPSRELMERAARAAIGVMLGSQELGVGPRSHIVILCGPGNNGGDGFAMARFLWEDGYDVTVCYGGACVHDKPLIERMRSECAEQYALWQEAGGVTRPTLACLTKKNTLVIDALLGIGLDREVTGQLREWIEAVNAAAEKGTGVLAIDLPSGVCAETGRVLGVAIRADVTATMAYPKRGLLLYPAAEYVGKLAVCDIGITDEAITDKKRCYLLEKSDLSPALKRPAYANKSTFGRVLVIGGSCGMAGAAYFAAGSAYRCGVGLVEVVSDEKNRVIMQTLLPEALFTPFEALLTDDDQAFAARLSLADAVVIGCGLGQSEQSARLVERTIRLCPKPLVLDADALNLLSKNPSWIEARVAEKAATVITPHLGEASRLCGRPIQEIADALFDVADELAERYGAVCVLKDARSVVSDGTTAYVQPCGNSGMATGGMGDCLTGVISALLARHKNAKEQELCYLASLGVLWHAAAGDAACKLGQNAMIARDVMDMLGSVTSILTN